MLILQYWNTMTTAHPNPSSLKPKFSSAKFAAEPQANAAKSAGNLCGIRSRKPMQLNPAVIFVAFDQSPAY